MGSTTITERVYLDANGKATTDPEKGVTLWATEGLDVEDAEVERVGYKAKATAKADDSKDAKAK